MLLILYGVIYNLNLLTFVVYNPITNGVLVLKLYTHLINWSLVYWFRIIHVWNFSDHTQLGLKVLIHQSIN